MDVFEAIKRARIRLGFVRRRRVRPVAPHAEPEQPPNPVPDREADRREAQQVEDGEENKNASLKQDGLTVLAAEEDPEALVNLTQNSQELLVEASTVFPLTLFPDTITVDREKLTIAKRTFFRVASVNSTPITDVQSVEVDVGPFFGAIRITSKYFVNNQREVRYLWREDATKIHRLLQGLILAHQRQADINTLDKEQLLILLADLGQGATD